MKKSLKKSRACILFQQEILNKKVIEDIPNMMVGKVTKTVAKEKRE